MFRTLKVAAVVLSLVSPLVAQNVALAAVTPEGVVEQCEIAAGAPSISAATCVAATEEYLGTLSTPSVGADEAIQSLIVQLLELSQRYPDCDAFDNSLATAIRAASAGVTDAALQAQYASAAAAIDDCQVTNLGAIAASPNA